MARIECRFDPELPMCGDCFDTNLWFDASAYYDREKRKFVLDSTHDYTYCTRCEGETRDVCLRHMINRREDNGEDVKKT